MTAFSLRSKDFRSTQCQRTLSFTYVSLEHLQGRAACTELARTLHKAGYILRTNIPMLQHYTLVSTYKPEDRYFSDDDAQISSYLVPTKVITTLGCITRFQCITTSWGRTTSTFESGFEDWLSTLTQVDPKSCQSELSGMSWTLDYGVGLPQALAHQWGAGFRLFKKAQSNHEILPSAPGQRFWP